MLKLYKSTKYQNDCRLSSPAFMTFSRFFSSLRVIEQWLQKKSFFYGSRLGNWRSRTMGSRPSISIRKRRTSKAARRSFSTKERRPVFFSLHSWPFSPLLMAFSADITVTLRKKNLEFFFLPNQPWPFSSVLLLTRLKMLFRSKTAIKIIFQDVSASRLSIASQHRVSASRLSIAVSQ